MSSLYSPVVDHIDDIAHFDLCIAAVVLDSHIVAAAVLDSCMAARDIGAQKARLDSCIAAADSDSCIAAEVLDSHDAVPDSYSCVAAVYSIVVVDLADNC